MQTAEDVATDTPDQTGEVDANPSLITEKLDALLDALTYALPNLAFALFLVMLTFFVGKGVERIVKRRLATHDRTDLGQLLGSLLKWIMVVGAVVLGATLVFPTLSPGDLVSGLGVGSVAIGFAFKDILQNWLAGLLLLVRRPFHPGDQIEVGPWEGTVEHVETRSTRIRTYDGQYVVVPNNEVYTKAVLVKTERDVRRSQIDVEVAFRETLSEVRAALLAAIHSTDGVLNEPKPDVLAWDLGATSSTIRCRWWSKAFRADVVETHARVVEAIHRVLNDPTISRPLHTEVHLDYNAPASVVPIQTGSSPKGEIEE
ncbi:MAG: mechanosensitive ion channel family protein [Litorimonas sp.]